MENIRFISTTYVQPQNQIDHQFTKLELTPCDVQLLLVETIQKGLLFHKPDKQSLKLIEHLKASFSRTLDIFYPLAGRLAVTENEDDNTTSFSLDCNGAGAEFVHAAADGVTVADILDPVLVPDNIVYSLFLMNGVLNYEGKSKPLLAVQVTDLVDGIFIGMTMNHSVGDGTCFWNFFNTWSEISRSGTSTMAKPIFGREFLDGIIHLPIRIPFFQYLNPEDKVVLPMPSLKQRVFHFRKEKIAALKSKANAQMATCKISSLQALMGHLWVSITRARGLISSATEDAVSQEITKYIVIVGMRQRLHVPLSDQYLGNAVLFVTATTTVGELLQGGLGFAAMEPNKVIALQTEQEVKTFLEGFVENPSLPKGSAVMKSNSLITGSSPRFDVYGNDFCWGRPVAVRSGSGNKVDGKLTVFAGACLWSETLQALAEDEEFMQKSTSSLPPVLLEQRMFHFSKENIAGIKAKANSQMGTSKISSLQALLGHLWLSIARAECHSSGTDQETKYKVLVGMRQRLKPPLPDQYLRNAVLFGVVKSTVGNLVEQGLGWAAWEMSRMVASQTEQEVKKFLEDWMESPQVTNIRGVANRILLTGSSPRFNVYGNDFGWGRPVAVRSGAGNKYDGKLTVFPGAEEGNIEFEACLSSETLQALAEDAEFMDSVTNVRASQLLHRIELTPWDLTRMKFSYMQKGLLFHKYHSSEKELADGIFISCSVNHSVVDDTSFWHFLNTWS
ncbi:hypothetical protein ACLB2K_003696 [Fragaria x ananassa]